MPTKRDQVEIKHKNLPALVVETDEKLGIVTEIVAVFGNIDDGDDIIHPGAFKKTILENFHRIRVLDQHKTDSVLRVVGKPLSLREIGKNELPKALKDRYPDAVGGLEAKTQYLIDTPEGLGVFKRIDKGAVTERSFGYDIVQADVSKVVVEGKTKVVTNLRELRLWEISPVIWGMNPATMTVDVKEGNPSDQKEYTPEGPQKRLGDVLIGGVHWGIIAKVSTWLETGYLSTEEYLAFNTLATQIVELIQTSTSEDVLMRPLATPVYVDWLWERGAPNNQKDEAPEESGVSPAAEGEAAQDDQAEPDTSEDVADAAPLTADEDSTAEKAAAELAEKVKRQRLMLRLLEVSE